MTRMRRNNGLFIANVATGISYADRYREEHGDYTKIAHLSFGTLVLTVYDKQSPYMKDILQHAHRMQVSRGQPYQVSTAGQFVTLGFAL